MSAILVYPNTIKSTCTRTRAYHAHTTLTHYVIIPSYVHNFPDDDDDDDCDGDGDGEDDDDEVANLRY